MTESAQAQRQLGQDEKAAAAVASAVAAAAARSVTVLQPFSLGVIEVIRIEGEAGRIRLEGRSGHADVVVQPGGHALLAHPAGDTRLDHAVICLSPPGSGFELQARAAFDHHVLRIPEAAMQNLLRDCRPLCLNAIPACCGAGAIFNQTVASIYDQRDQLGAADYKNCGDAVLSLLCSVLRSFAREISEEASVAERYHLERVKAFALEHLANPELDVRLIAQGVELSASYIHRLFAGSAMTLMQWIHAERLDACHRELSSPCSLKRPMYAVAQDWGFSNQAHFSRAFRARFGVSPSAVREAVRSCACEAG